VYCKEDFGKIHEFDQHCKSESHLSMMKAPSRQKKYTLDHVLSMCREKNFIMENWWENENIVCKLLLMKILYMNILLIYLYDLFPNCLCPNQIDFNLPQNRRFTSIYERWYFILQNHFYYNKIQSHFEPVEICKISAFWFYKIQWWKFEELLSGCKHFQFPQVIPIECVCHRFNFVSNN
jgi:hypothetical protein